MKKLSVMIILVLMTSCTIPIVQKPQPLPLPEEKEYPFVDTQQIIVNGDTVTMPKSVLDAITLKMKLKSLAVKECRTIIQSTQ